MPYRFWGLLDSCLSAAVFPEPVQDEMQRRIIAAALPKHPVPGAMGSIELMSYVRLCRKVFRNQVQCTVFSN